MVCNSVRESLETEHERIKRVQRYINQKKTIKSNQKSNHHRLSRVPRIPKSSCHYFQYNLAFGLNIHQQHPTKAAIEQPTIFIYLFYMASLYKEMKAK